MLKLSFVFCSAGHRQQTKTQKHKNIASLFLHFLLTKPKTQSPLSSGTLMSTPCKTCLARCVLLCCAAGLHQWCCTAWHICSVLRQFSCGTALHGVSIRCCHAAPCGTADVSCVSRCVLRSPTLCVLSHILPHWVLQCICADDMSCAMRLAVLPCCAAFHPSPCVSKHPSPHPPSVCSSASQVTMSSQDPNQGFSGGCFNFKSPNNCTSPHATTVPIQVKVLVLVASLWASVSRWAVLHLAPLASQSQPQSMSPTQNGVLQAKTQTCTHTW